MGENIIRAAVVGMGNMGSQYAALLAAGAVPGMALAAVTRVRPETLAARHLALPAGLPVYQTADELFAAVDSGALGLDAVVIATPHRLHEEQAVAAMRRGLCVLCDKPAAHWERRPMEKDPDAYAAVLRNFAACVRAGDPEGLLAPWREGRKSLTLSNAIYLSSWTGQTVALPAPGSAAEQAFEAAFEAEWRKQFA